MDILTREQLLAKEELKTERVDFEDGKGSVFVRMMTGRERDRFEQSLMREETDKKGRVTYKRALEDFRAKLAVNTVCDETGKNIFQPQDYDELSQNMGAARLKQIADAAGRLNKITEEEGEDLVKNSESGPNESDTSESGAAM